MNAPLVRDSGILDHSYQETALGPDVVAWLSWMELGGAADSTLDQYERDLSRLCLTFPTKAVGDLDDADLSRVIRSFPKPSRRVRKAALDSFFKWAIKTRRIERNPCDFLPTVKRQPQKVPDIFTEAEIEAFTNLPLVDAALVLVLLETGIRKSEACKLQASHCSFERGQLTVINGKGGKDRIIPLTKQVASVLAELFLIEGLNPTDYLWYTRPGGTPRLRRKAPIGEGSFARWWERCIKTAGVRYRKPHSTRHTFATNWRRRGLAVDELQILLGHSSISTTSDLYIHTNVQDVADHMALIESLRTAEVK